MSLLLNLWAWIVILALTAGGLALSLFSYYAGKRGAEAVLERFPRIDPKRLEEIGIWYQRHGTFPLLLTFIPLLGSLLSVGAGVYGVRLVPFVVWVSLVKLGRNWLIALALYTGYKRLF